jgi:Domain of unknown function (DUF4439)
MSELDPVRVNAAGQAALAAEEQAVFGYALLGPQLSGTDQQLAVTCSNAHEDLRDALQDNLVAAGQTPVQPLPDYPGLYPVATAAAARRLAVRLEEAGASAWRYLYLQAAATTAAASRPVRARAQAGLTASAVRATQWRELIDPGQATTPFPGV